MEIRVIENDPGLVMQAENSTIKSFLDGIIQAGKEQKKNLPRVV